MGELEVENLSVDRYTTEFLKELQKEQEEFLRKKALNDYTLVPYIKTNIQEMSGNAAPLPDDTSQEWIYFIYEKTLEKEIQKFQELLNQDGDGEVLQDGVQDDPVYTSSSSDSDLEAYFPKKRFAIAATLTRTTKRA